MKPSSSLAIRRYSAQPRDQIFVKGYGLLFFANNMGKTIGKNISKNWSGKCSQNFLIMLNNQKQMRLKRFQNEQLKQQQKQLEISLVIKLLIKSQMFQYIHTKKIFQRQLRMRIIKKYLKKIYLSRKKTGNY